MLLLGFCRSNIVPERSQSSVSNLRPSGVKAAFIVPFAENTARGRCVYRSQAEMAPRAVCCQPRSSAAVAARQHAAETRQTSVVSSLFEVGLGLLEVKSRQAAVRLLQ